MVKRLIVLMAALMLMGFVVTGCGDDESSSNDGDTAAEVTDTVTDDERVTDDETVTDTVTEETDTDVTSDDNGGAVAPEALKQAVESCKDNIDRTPQLSGDAKDKLQDICEKAGSADPDEVRDAAQEYCRAAAEALPEGQARSLALDACDNAGQ